MVRIHGDFHQPQSCGGVFASIAAGVCYVWADVPLRAFVIYASFVSVFVGGPIQLGLRVLADKRFNHGAASLGILMTAQGVGIFTGSFLSGTGQCAMRGHLGVMILCFDSVMGLALAALIFVHTTWFGALVLLCAGLPGGTVRRMLQARKQEAATSGQAKRNRRAQVRSAGSPQRRAGVPALRPHRRRNRAGRKRIGVTR